MYKHSALLSISAALLFSLSFLGVGHAIQVEKRQHARTVRAGEMKETTTVPTKQVANTPNPCTVGGKGRTGAPDKKRCPVDSGEQARDGALYTSTTTLR